jgi:hypothetical protein
MSTKITYTNTETGEETTEKVSGDIFSIVSLFETWTVAFDASKLSKEQIEKATNIDREEAEDFLDEVTGRIDLVSAETTATDNDYHAINEQSEVHAIVLDVNGVVECHGGVREYMDNYGEYWNAVYGDNGELIVEDDEAFIAVSIEEDVVC